MGLGSGACRPEKILHFLGVSLAEQKLEAAESPRWKVIPASLPATISGNYLHTHVPEVVLP